MTSFSGMITIGVIVKPQGRHGELVVEPLSDRPQRFPELKRAFLPGAGDAPREVQVTSVWPHKGRFVVKIEGVDSIDDADLLRGQELRIPEAELAALPEGEYYHHQLKGLSVSDETGTALGKVEDILQAGSAPVLVVRGPGGETLIPLAEHFIRQVDLAGGRLTVAVMETVEERS